jgi:hypothetical protein
MRSIIITLALAAFASGPVMAGEILVEGSFPIVGEPMVLSVSGIAKPENHTLRVVYAPNSETQTAEESGRLSTDGTIAWNPARFGIATLTVTDDAGSTVATENVAILPAETPAGGVLVMIFAGVLLFGGAGWSLRSVLASGVPEQLPPKDT